MSVREYIGARYVPLFDGDWSVEKNYEPLTIVSSGGNSYTSRQFVPAGTLLTNAQYWALTGNYNAQVEQYRSEVQTYSGAISSNSEAIATETAARIAADESLSNSISGFDSRITNNQNAINAEETARTAAVATLQTAISAEESARTAADAAIESDLAALESNVYTKAQSDARYMMRAASGDDLLVCIGDSILAGWSEENPNSIAAWDTYLANTLGYDVNNVFKNGVGGAGFATGTQFSSMVASVVSAIQAAGKSTDDVNMVVLGGGVNDARNDVGHTPMRNGAAAFMNAAAQAFPNAAIHIFPMVMGNIGLNSKLLLLEEYVKEACFDVQASVLNKIVFHPGVWSWNYDGNDDGVSTDRIHLLAAGQKLVGRSMALEINGGDAYNNSHWFGVSDINGNTLTAGYRRGTMVSFSLATNVTSAGGSNLALGVDKRYGVSNGCIAFSNENENGNRIFFYSMNDETFNSYQALSNAGCYGTASYAIESAF